MNSPLIKTDSPSDSPKPAAPPAALRGGRLLFSAISLLTISLVLAGTL